MARAGRVLHVFSKKYSPIANVKGSKARGGDMGGAAFRGLGGAGLSTDPFHPAGRWVSARERPYKSPAPTHGHPCSLQDMSNVDFKEGIQKMLGTMPAQRPNAGDLSTALVYKWNRVVLHSTKTGKAEFKNAMMMEYPSYESWPVFDGDEAVTKLSWKDNDPTSGVALPQALECTNGKLADMQHYDFKFTFTGFRFPQTRASIPAGDPLFLPFLNKVLPRSFVCLHKTNTKRPSFLAVSSGFNFPSMQNFFTVEYTVNDTVEIGCAADIPPVARLDWSRPQQFPLGKLAEMEAHWNKVLEKDMDNHAEMNAYESVGMEINNRLRQQTTLFVDATTALDFTKLAAGVIKEGARFWREYCEWAHENPGKLLVKRGKALSRVFPQQFETAVFRKECFEAELARRAASTGKRRAEAASDLSVREKRLSSEQPEDGGFSSPPPTPRPRSPAPG